jgi:hypothetical protein
LAEVLLENSTHSRGALKERLYEAGLAAQVRTLRPGAEVAASSWSAVGRKYGVSDRAYGAEGVDQ